MSTEVYRSRWGVILEVMNLPDLSQFDAVLFDLDGVITPTAAVHKTAWQMMFSDWLKLQQLDGYRPGDYELYLDGRQRYDGVAAFLESRGASLPWGSPEDPPEAETVCGLGNRKDREFNRILEESGVTPFPGAVELISAVQDAGLAIAVVSSSRNARPVLEAAGLLQQFPLVLGGVEAAALELPSKPAPDSFLHAAAELGVDPARAVVIEDAIPGVQAGRAGQFGLTVGVGSAETAAALSEAGADIVVEDLSGLARHIRAGGMDRERFPVDEWRLVETIPPAGIDGLAETLFAIGNGYLGMRGNPEENGPAHEHGTFINGFHATWPIRYPEAAYGFATVGQTIINVPDAKTIRLTVDGERLEFDDVRVSDYERSLDFRDGVLRRSFTWTTTAGKRVRVASSRFVSFVRRNLAVFSFEVTALDAPVEVQLESLLINRQDGEGKYAARQLSTEFDPRQADELQGRVLQPEGTQHEGGRTGLTWRAAGSGTALATVVQHEPAGDSSVSADLVSTVVERCLQPGESVTWRKNVVWMDDDAADSGDLLRRAGAIMDDAASAGPDQLLTEQRNWLDRFWEHGDVKVAGQPDAQQAIHWNLLQLAQASARADGRGVSAKGVSGSGYSGHYFWDTEIYVLPFLAYVLPAAARNALELRHSMLPAARRRAETMSVSGALFPWRTINGEEASAYYPAGTAQYHINADVAHALLRYAAVTGDEEFLTGPGSEILIETARMWFSLGHFSEDGRSFHIHSVTGPDEYSAVVNDNVYTNAMARLNLEAAADQAGRQPGLLGTTADELQDWRRAARSMYLPYDDARQIHGQDDSFLKRKRWDLAATPREKRPLLLHYHPLVIYRHQVLKQVDLILAQFLLSGQFDADQKRRDFEYYDPLTTGDSTLSAAVQSIMAAEVGYPQRALRHFRRMLWTDLADLHGNSADGVHVAAMGGTWLALVSGMAGLRDDGASLRFDPRLPDSWSGLEFRLQWRGSSLAVALTSDKLGFSLVSGEPVTLSVRGEEYTVTDELTVSLQRLETVPL